MSKKPAKGYSGPVIRNAADRRRVATWIRKWAKGSGDLPWILSQLCGIEPAKKKGM